MAVLVGLVGALQHGFKARTGQILGGRLSDRDGLIGHYIVGRHHRAPGLLPARALGTGREGEGQAEVEVGARQVPVFTGRVDVPFLPTQASGPPPVQVGFGVWGRWVGGHCKHVGHVEVDIWRCREEATIMS